MSTQFFRNTSNSIETPSPISPPYSPSCCSTTIKKAPSRVRMKMCDAPKNLVKLINSNYITPSPAIISDNIKVNNIVSKGNSSNNIGKDNNKDRNVNQAGSITTLTVVIRNHRKIPYPVPPRIPSSTPSFILRSTVYELYTSNSQKLIETTTKAISTVTSRSGKLPAPPQMDFDTLMKAIDQLKIDHNILDNTTSRIIWKGQPLQISHLPKYDILHPKEAEVASILRLTPIQYLTAKHTLVSASRKYAASSFEFRKSDAQKLLRIDVNKA
ncbi:13616_t:CDS:2, partial [Entrophospora sp. SA101]